MEGETTQVPVVVVPVVEETAPVAVVEAPIVAEASEVAPAPVDVPMDVPVPVVEASAPVVEAAAAVPAQVEEPKVATEEPKKVEEEGEKKPKPKRVTRALLKRHVRKGKLLENQLFSWRTCEVPEDCDEGDFIFYGCKMKIDLKRANGEVAVPAGKMVKRVEWYTSHSIAAFFPSNFDSSAILIPLVLQAPNPIPLV